MEWNKLLSEKRMEDEISEPDIFKDYPINEFEKDYKRIISSASFRRLQDKTQVFPLDKSDFVRTRLTHSIEVSTIAKQLGAMITKNVQKYKSKDEHVIEIDNAQKITEILMCAGLLHDLGNPPFGHFGEVVIGEWFSNYLNKLEFKGKALSEYFTDQMKNDLKNFEGNAQAIRILSKINHIQNGYGINLQPVF